MGAFEGGRRQLRMLAVSSAWLIVAAGVVASCTEDGLRPLAVALLAAVAVTGLLTPARVVGPLAGALAAAVFAGAGPTVGSGPTIAVAASLVLTGVAGSGMASRLAGSTPRTVRWPGVEQSATPAPRGPVMAGAAFRQALELEIARARRYDHTLSLLVVGVEDWPTLVAQRGQQAAERRLAALAEALRCVVRDVDSVGAYGPGHLTILLPETALSGAAVVAGKVERVARESGTRTTRVGAASYPEDGSTCDELLREAEAALDLARLAHVSFVSRARLD